MKRFFSLLLTALLCAGVFSSSALAADRVFLIDDQAQLLTKEERSQLQSSYEALTDYANVALVTANQVSGSTSSYAKSYLNSRFDSGAAIVFLIDMDNRQLYIYSNARGVGMVSPADARAITDNVYTYATKGDYYQCADAALSQILKRCQGGQIARPVKHITNALIAVVAGILLNFLWAVFSRSGFSGRHATATEMREMAVLPDFQVGEPILLKSEKQYHDSGSGGSGGSGGGGGGGGGHGF